MPMANISCISGQEQLTNRTDTALYNVYQHNESASSHPHPQPPLRLIILTLSQQVVTLSPKILYTWQKSSDYIFF